MGVRSSWWLEARYALQTSQPSMRSVALLLFLLASSSAPVAQQRFQSACVDASGKEASMEAEDARVICACAAETAMMQGISGASLDGLMQYIGADGALDLTGAPPPVQALSEVVVQGLFICLFQQIDDALATMEITSIPEENVPQVPLAETPSSATAGPPFSPEAAPRATPPPSGSERRATRAGRGATVRIQR